MSMFIEFVCDYSECGERSKVPADYIDTYSWHDAPGEGVIAEPPPGWLHDILYHWIACPKHRDEMLANRSRYGAA